MTLPLRKKVARLAAHAALTASLCSCACSGSSSSSTTSPTTATATLLSVSLSAQTIAGGLALTGTITLSAAAPASGALVALASSSAVATVPASVTVTAGSTTQTFSIDTVATSTSSTATITATYAGVSQTAALSVTRLTLQGLSLSAPSVASGLSVTGTLTLTAPAAADGVLVTLSSSAPTVVVPATVLIGAGQSAAAFDVTTQATTSPIVDTLTAAIPASGSVRTATLLVAPLQLDSLSLGFTQWPGGTSALGMINLTVAAPPGGVVVAVQSSSPLATVPASVAIPNGVASQSFPISVDNAPPARAVTITASYGGRTSSATFTVVALPTIAGLTCTPLSVVGGNPVQCSGTIAAAAPAEGWQLSVASLDPSTSGVDVVPIAPSGTTFSFTLATTPVTTTTPVTIRILDRATGWILYAYPLTVTAS
jgi:hypothetical protein